MRGHERGLHPPSPVGCLHKRDAVLAEQADHLREGQPRQRRLYVQRLRGRQDDGGERLLALCSVGVTAQRLHLTPADSRQQPGVGCLSGHRTHPPTHTHIRSVPQVARGHQQIGPGRAPHLRLDPRHATCAVLPLSSDVAHNHAARDGLQGAGRGGVCGQAWVRGTATAFRTGGALSHRCWAQQAPVQAWPSCTRSDHGTSSAQLFRRPLERGQQGWAGHSSLGTPHLWQVSDAVFHGGQRICHSLAMQIDLDAGHPVGGVAAGQASEAAGVMEASKAAGVMGASKAAGGDRATRWR